MVLTYLLSGLAGGNASDLDTDPVAIVADHHSSRAQDLFEFHQQWIVLPFFLLPDKSGIVLQRASMRNAAMHFAICDLWDGLDYRSADWREAADR